MNLTVLKRLWRAHTAVKVGQVWRFLRVTTSVLAAQLLAQIVSNGDLNSVTHLDQKAAVALVAGAAETAWRQLHPAVTVEESTQVPTPVEGGAVPVTSPAATVSDVSANSEGDAAP